MKSFLSTINKKIRSKLGTYILEASVIFPPLVVALALLVSAIPVVSAGENALYVMWDEIRSAGIRAAFVQEPASLPAMVSYRISVNERESIDSWIRGYDYLFEEGGIEDLISVEVESSFSGENPLGGISLFRSRQRVMGRAFTGKEGRGNSGEDALTGSEESHIVYIFPSRGEKYHNRNCAFLNPASQKVFLTKDIKRKFKACPNCHSGNAELGDQVFCFFTVDGKAYHLGSCSAVDKYYVEIEKKDAEAKGYTPCMTCGG